MTAANWPACLVFTLREEGGWSDNPADPGGATMDGITLAAYRAWRGDETLTAADLNHMWDSERDKIYAARYWDAVRANDLAPGIDLMLFDFGVTAGPETSIRLLQSALGVTVDSIIGPITLSMLAMRTPRFILPAVAHQQNTYYASLADFGIFGKGWLARSSRRLIAAEQMSAGSYQSPST